MAWEMKELDGAKTRNDYSPFGARSLPASSFSLSLYLSFLHPNVLLFAVNTNQPPAKPYNDLTKIFQNT